MSDYSDGVEPAEADPRLGKPGELGQPAPFDDSVDNLLDSQKDPKMEDSRIDPAAPISSAKGKTNSG